MTPELQEIAGANEASEAVPAMLMKVGGQWLLVVAARHSDGVLRHVDADATAFAQPMVDNLAMGDPANQAAFAAKIEVMREAHKTGGVH